MKMEKQHFILQHGVIVKKLPNFLFHMVQISMKKNEDGETALHIAAQRNSKETAEVLISHVANNVLI
ncbi:hypothetical protein TVAG_408410 [Trichomonas vaginalis G3]|uniref:Uncharacterized protein n=1 Tax=Trichomonas vaginalis (strain ATCC PRA-98 / G3) TaxID=412133 RepID=A2F6P2_TRIV3|nr:proteasome regulatory particle assembly [Trichomonas vaginalis G3]EAX99431.1 hypothetical protein TVAG_408410 [Trichomonas vaginalis G3]KAI5516134.1 proteasome regulatory particle assembly [Trichomonas vaginalis G3]|eukprot:XP_001312361.1 hypothetical protein [Trichomonas vaginalis G3]